MTNAPGGAALSGLLAELEERLRRWRAPILEAFRPGASAEQVRSVLGAEGLAVPDAVVAWWGWHDGAEGVDVVEGPGVVETPENTLVDGWHVLSLADAIRIRRWTLADYAQLGAPDTVPASWIPLLHFTGSPYLAADTAAPEGGSPLYVVDGSAGLPEREPQPQFPSLDELVTALIGLFDDGVVRPDPDDARVPSLRGSPDTETVRSLTRW